MCRHGKTRDLLVNIPARLSHTGLARWDKKPIDECLYGLVSALNANGILTEACCCGHGLGPGEILLQDGTKIVVPAEWSVPSQWLHAADPAKRAGFEEVLVRR